MTITTMVQGNFHRSTCLPMGNDPSQDCRNTALSLKYRCSRCMERCIKCEATRLNNNASFIRGCEEARMAIGRTFSCVCTPAQGCET
ncbi:MAG: hypothetical protein ACRCU0_01090 [Candidatus Rhabdochlamydia sp.]